MPHKGYHGKTGRVYTVTRRAVGVVVNKRIKNRILAKRINVRIEHVKHSTSRQGHIDRAAKNDALKAAANKIGKKAGNMKRIVSLLRQPPPPHFCRAALSLAAQCVEQGTQPPLLLASRPLKDLPPLSFAGYRHSSRGRATSSRPRTTRSRPSRRSSSSSFSKYTRRVLNISYFGPSLVYPRRSGARWQGGQVGEMKGPLVVYGSVWWIDSARCPRPLPTAFPQRRSDRGPGQLIFILPTSAEPSDFGLEPHNLLARGRERLRPLILVGAAVVDAAHELRQQLVLQLGRVPESRRGRGK